MEKKKKKKKLSGKKENKDANEKIKSDKIRAATELEYNFKGWISQEKSVRLKGNPYHFSGRMGSNEQCQLVELVVTQSTLFTGK